MLKRHKKSGENGGGNNSYISKADTSTIHIQRLLMVPHTGVTGASFGTGEIRHKRRSKSHMMQSSAYNVKRVSFYTRSCADLTLEIDAPRKSRASVWFSTSTLLPSRSFRRSEVSYIHGPRGEGKKRRRKKSVTAVNTLTLNGGWTTTSH